MVADIAAGAGRAAVLRVLDYGDIGQKGYGFAVSAVVSLYELARIIFLRKGIALCQRIAKRPAAAGKIVEGAAGDGGGVAEVNAAKGAAGDIQRAHGIHGPAVAAVGDRAGFPGAAVADGERDAIIE